MRCLEKRSRLVWIEEAVAMDWLVCDECTLVILIYILVTYEVTVRRKLLDPGVMS